MSRDVFGPLQKPGLRTCHFAPKTWDAAEGYLKCAAPHISQPAMRTDGRSRDYYVTTYYDLPLDLSVCNESPVPRV